MRLWRSPWRSIASVAIPRTLNDFEREMTLFSILDTIDQRGWLSYVIPRGIAFVGSTLKKNILHIHPKHIDLDEDFTYRLWLLKSARDHRQTARRTLEQASKVRVTVLLNVTELTEDIVHSVESVINQVHKNWRLLVLSEPSKNTELTEFMIRRDLRDERIHVPTDLDVSTFGDAITFLESGDVLEDDALLEVAAAFESDDIDAVYTDSDKISNGFRYGHFFKPDWSPELLLSTNYVGHLYAIRKGLWKQGFTCPWSDSQYYDLVLRTTTEAGKVLHIPKILYSEFMQESETSPTDPDMARAVEGFLKDRGILCTVRPGLHPGTFRAKCRIQQRPMITLIVPTYRRFDLLQDCLTSVRSLTTYGNYEILIIYHGSVVPRLLLKISRNLGCRLLQYPDPRYAFGEMNNFGCLHARGDFLVFLNDDTKVITPSWLEAMLEWAQLEKVAAVGAKLLYADNSLNHAGDMIIGTAPNRGPTHAFKGVGANSGGYNYLADVVRNCSCVTAACMMIRKKIFEELNCFNGRFTSYDDVDLCLRALEKSYRNVYTPHAVLYHYETASRKGQIRAFEEYRSLMYLRERHPQIMENGDPYYNRNLDPDGGYRLTVTPKPGDIPKLYIE